MKWRPAVVGTGVAVAAALALGSCSSSPATSSSTTGSTGAPTTTPSGSGGAPTTSAANFNSCSVVTQAEAASALGTSVTPGVLGSATVEGGLACVFYGPSAPTPTTPDVAQADSVRVVVVKGSDALTWYNNYKSSSQVHAQPMPGYGDQAYYDGYASLSVMKGDDYLRVAVAPRGTPPNLTGEEQLVDNILPRLP